MDRPACEPIDWVEEVNPKGLAEILGFAPSAEHHFRIEFDDDSMLFVSFDGYVRREACEPEEGGGYALIPNFGPYWLNGMPLDYRALDAYLGYQLAGLEDRLADLLVEANDNY